MSSPIAISIDPRFILARKLITSGSPESAIDIFANLLENCREKLGEDSLDATLCQFEYGNALFRAALHKDVVEGEGEDEDDGKPRAKGEGGGKREMMAAAAEKRFGTDPCTEPTKKRAKTDADLDKTTTDEIAENQDSADEDDVSLALEMIETALHILLEKVAATSEPKGGMSDEQKEWSMNQIPRYLICLGDVYSFQKEHNNAVDAYIRALSYREDKVKEAKENKNPFTIEQLQCTRLYIEACALVAEALLACPDGQDVVCEFEDETVTYVKAAERVDFANSWFVLAREELDDLCKCDIYEA